LLVRLLLSTAIAALAPYACDRHSALSEGSATRESNPDHQGAGVTWGQEQHGLRSRIWVDRKAFGLHDTVSVHYAIQNVSKTEQVVWHSGFWPNNRIEVTGPSGAPAALTELGKQARKSFSPGGPREKNVPVSLKPGETDSAWHPFNLRDYFVMDAAGAYLVRYIYQEPGVTVTSNRLTIDVKAP